MTTRVMDFFENQDAARRRTGLLVFYYILAVILIILAVYAAFTAAFTGLDPAEAEGFWNPGLMLAVSGATILIVLSGSLYKVKQLSAGGKAVAELLGGKPVNMQTAGPEERRLLNIVEEMSIASGVQVPRIYILEQEEGINAFAAGFSPDDAVIGVTRGCLNSLNRDELQGVIAHEFSHILNGDMRLNIRLMGVLHGIIIIAFLGYLILRSSFYTGHRRSSRSGGKDGRAAAILFGFALVAIGYIGVFFGNLIKSAVSRQREYLADAAAVQFTRNPSGIGSALKKIAGLTAGSKVQNVNAQEASHLFFSSSLSGSLMRLMATHPPIDDRIRRIDPSLAEGKVSAQTGRTNSESAVYSGFAGAPVSGVQPQDVTAAVGTAQPVQLEYASKLLSSIPQSLRDAARGTEGARAVMYLLLLSADTAIKEKQQRYLEKYAGADILPRIKDLAGEMSRLPVEYRIPLMDLAVLTLKSVRRDTYTRFAENISKLIEADGKISLFEYTVQKMLLRHLAPAFGRPEPPKVHFRSLKPLSAQCRILLSCLAENGIDDENMKESAFREAAAKLDTEMPMEFLQKGECALETLDKALDDLDKAAPQLKKRIIDACVTCVVADGHITVSQTELLRITADAIGCPVPPMLPVRAAG